MNRVYPTKINWENEEVSHDTPINSTNLNKMDTALYEIDGRVVTFDLTKANQSDLLQTIKTLTYNTTTGVFVFEFWNGGTYTVDLNIEKIPVSFRLTEQGVLIMTTADGTEYRCDIAALIKIYTFADSTEIDFTTTTDSSGNKTITAQIKAGSITGDKLQPNYLADCVDAKNAAQLAASNAQQSEDDANASALVSEGWANGKQNGVPVTEGSPYYHNNAEYWKDQANPTRLASLSDVNFGTLKDDEIIVYDATSQKWKNEVGVSADLKSNTTGQFNTRTGGKLESCVIAFEPKQSGSGTPSPQNVRPITGHAAVEVWEHGKNYLPLTVSGIKSVNTGGVWSGNVYTINGVTFTIHTDNDGNVTGIKVEGTATATVQFNVCPTIPNSNVVDTMKLSGCPSGGQAYVSYQITAVKSDGSSDIAYDTGSGATITKESLGTTNLVIRIRINNGYAIASGGLMFYPMLRLATETDATFEPYKGQDVIVNLGGTYYGGKFDAVSGVLTVDEGYLTENDFTAVNTNTSTGGLHWTDYMLSAVDTHMVLCNMIEPKLSTQGWSSTTPCVQEGAISPTQYSVRIYCTESNITDFRATYSGLQIVYKLPTPLTIQLTPQQINTLIGENHLDIPLEGQSLDSAVYRELFAWDDVNDVVKAVDDKNADVSAIGTDESGRTTASKAYAIYSFFYKDGYFCRTQTTVAQGATWTLGTNYIRMSVAEMIYLLNNKVTQWGTLAGDVITVAKALGNNTISWYMNSNNPTNAPSNHKWGQYLIIKSSAEICAFIYFDPSAVCYASTNTLSTDTSLSWTGATLSAL